MISCFCFLYEGYKDFLLEKRDWVESEVCNGFMCDFTSIVWSSRTKERNETSRGDGEWSGRNNRDNCYTKKHKEKKLQESEVKAVIDIINNAEKQEITGSFGEPEYEIQISRDGKKEKYYAWLRGEDRRGWLQYKKAMYMLNEKDTEKLLSIFPKIPEQKEDEIQVDPLTEVTKKICRLQRFILKQGIKKWIIRYVIRFRNHFTTS